MSMCVHRQKEQKVLHRSQKWERSKEGQEEGKAEEGSEMVKKGSGQLEFHGCSFGLGEMFWRSMVVMAAEQSECLV